LSAWIRELGFRATIMREVNAEALAVQAGLGTLNGEGKLVADKFGTGIYVADPVYTDLPLAADG